MLKKLSILFCSVIIAFALSACDSSSGEKDKDAPANYTAMSGDVYLAVSTAMSQAIAAGKSKASGGDISTSGTGWIATGSYSFTGEGTSYTLHIVWSGFTSNGVTFNSGSVDITYLISSLTGDLTYTYDGDFVVLYGSVTYNFGWAIDLTVIEGVYSFAGEYIVNDESFIWGWEYTAK